MLYLFTLPGDIDDTPLLLLMSTSSKNYERGNEHSMAPITELRWAH